MRQWGVGAAILVLGLGGLLNSAGAQQHDGASPAAGEVVAAPMEALPLSGAAGHTR